MKIDNSAAETFRVCPALWYEKYVRKIQPVVVRPGGKEFGTRFHEVLLSYYSGKKLESPKWPEIEGEVQAMFEAYRAKYVEEAFKVELAEQTLEVPIGPWVPCGCAVWTAESGTETETPTAYPWHTVEVAQPTELVSKFDPLCGMCQGKGIKSQHTYVYRCDLVVSDKLTGNLQIFDTKTERRNSKANIPQAWAAKDQATLYLWAMGEHLNKPVDSLVLNVCTRGSEKGQVGPTFRRDTLFRTRGQMEKAVSDLVETADMMEEMLAKHPEGDVPQWRQNCVDRTTGWPCDFYSLHVLGESEALLKTKFEVAEDYLKKTVPLSSIEDMV